MISFDDIHEPPCPRVPTGSAVDHWPIAVLLERAAYLRELAKYGDGSATETLREYSQHLTMLCFRRRDSAVEADGNFANLFYILDGRATMLTGRMVTGADSAGAGEIEGGSIAGGTRHELRAGDVLHIPACLPHQVLVAGENWVTYLVVKIQETQ